MAIFAAVMTGQGVGAISTIQLFGDSAETIIKKIFRPTGKKPLILNPGVIRLGTIADNGETIDQVTIGCEARNSFAINCHGNPLIVADIMQLLAKYDVKPLTAEQLLCKILSAEKSLSTIAIEARLTQPKAKTLEGTKIIVNQIHNGLSKTATQWLEEINTIPLKKITDDAEQILQASRTAKLIIAGCKTAIIGPPNTGKSTLLNYLTGRQKAIVTDIKGTTRDWVSGQCQIDSLALELIDTAGLDNQLTAAPEDTIEKVSQQKAVEILEEADLVLLVLDNSQSADQLDDSLIEKIAGKRILTVLNKSDLPAGFDAGKLPKALANTVQISAKLGTGIAELTEKIRQFLGVIGFDLKQPICITDRQKNLLEQLKNAKSKSKAHSLITELLNGRLRV
jgi:tRNA modification GTPase